MSNTTPLLLLLSLLLMASTVVVAKDPPATIILEQKFDAEQVLLIQTTNNGLATAAIEGECGLDTYYDTSAVVLGVNKTVDPNSAVLGAATRGKVMQVCDTLEFKTFDREWTNGDCEPDRYNDPGRKMEGWCGYVYLTPGVEAMDPYVVVATWFGFEEVDASVCEEKIVQCQSASDDGGGGGASADGESNGGTGVLSLGRSVVISLLLVVALVV